MLEEKCEDIDDFIDSFCTTLKLYQTHSFVAKMQATHYKQSKETLAEGDVLVICDFSENYSFVI